MFRRRRIVIRRGRLELRHYFIIIVAFVCVFAAAVAAQAMPVEDPAPADVAPSAEDAPAASVFPFADVAAGRPAAALRPKLLPRGSRYLLREIRHYRLKTWRWQRLMGKPRIRSSGSAARSRKATYRRWVLRLWKGRAARARRLAKNPPRKEIWLCIQRYEGSWRDPGAPYYGGLQMDLSFQRTYGRDLLMRKGTADNWTPVEQMWVAERAYRSGRGFTPWPNTSVMCAA